MVVVRTACLEMQGELGLDREPLERVREQRDGEGADEATAESERDLRVRAADEVDGGSRARLVHRHGCGAVPVYPLSAVERSVERIAECGEHVLDRVVLVHLEVSTGQDLEIK